MAEGVVGEAVRTAYRSHYLFAIGNTFATGDTGFIDDAFFVTLTGDGSAGVGA